MHSTVAVTTVSILLYTLNTKFHTGHVMQTSNPLNHQTIACTTGIGLLVSIVIGIISSIFISKGIDINLSADVLATAEKMLEAEGRLRAKAYMGILSLCISAIVSVGLYLLLRNTGQLLAGASLFLSLVAAVLMFLGSVFAMNAAEFASNVAYTLSDDKLMLASLQATSDYTSFHLGLVISSLSMAGFFFLFLKSSLIPKLIAGWGVFASVFVATAIVVRDFIPALGSNAITGAFMVSNLIALITLGVYLAFKGVRK